MKRLSIFIYGAVSYIFSLLTMIWFFLFIGPFDILQSHIDSLQTTSMEYAILINISLILLFALQHSIMAREPFKRRLYRFIPQAAERSTYVLFSGIFLLLICIYWQGVDGYLWKIEDEAVQTLLISLYIFGFIFSTVSSFFIDHFELFGLKQVYLNLIGRPAPQDVFMEKYLYKYIRHPIQLGTLIVLWATPQMSYSHLMLSVTFTIYVFVGLHYEERDLLRTFGEKYRAYQKRIPMIIPFLKSL